MIALLLAKNHQIPLIHIVHEDDVVLLNTQELVNEFSTPPLLYQIRAQQ